MIFVCVIICRSAVRNTAKNWRKKKKSNNWNHVLVLVPGNLHYYFDVVNNLVSNEEHFYWSRAAFNKDCVGILVFSQRHLTQTNAFYFILALLQPHSSHSVIR